jgi:hypothetical protein
MSAQAMTADEIGSKYPDLWFSKSEQEATWFFVVGDTVISIDAQKNIIVRSRLLLVSWYPDPQVLWIILITYQKLGASRFGKNIKNPDLIRWFFWLLLRSRTNV